MPLGRRHAKAPPPHQSGMNIVKMSNNGARANNAHKHVSGSDNNNNKIAFELPSNNSSSAVSSAPTSQAPTTTTASSDNDDNNELEGESDEDELALFKRLYGMEQLQQRRDATTKYDDEDEADFEDDNEYGGDEHDDEDEQQICSSNGGVVVNGATTMPITMIAPKKLAKPWQGSPNAKELHNELLFNEKMGIDVLKTKRSEFKRILNKIRDTQHKRESVEKNKTDLERAFEKRTANGKQQLIMTADDKLNHDTNNNGGNVFIDARMPGEQHKDRRRKSSGGFEKQPEFIREFYQRRASHPKV